MTILFTIATALHPRLHMLWFKSHWKDYPAWHRKAEASMRSVFRQYIDLEVEHETDEPPLPTLTRRREPDSNESSLFGATFEINMDLLT